MDSARGQLLIAGPALLDPNFWRTVVLVIEHTDEGALGLVLNRPSETTVGEAVPSSSSWSTSTTRCYIGGPVQPSALIVLGEFEEPDRRGADRLRRRRRARHRRRPRSRRSSVRRGRAFVGHAGWGPGQLDDEIERGDWILEPARARGRVHRRAAGPVVGGADAQGGQLRAGGADAAGPVRELIPVAHDHDHSHITDRRRATERGR